MPDSAVYEAVAERLRDGHRRLMGRQDPTEADVRQLVIGPVLTAIGYSDDYRRPEQGDGRNRPDELCYTTDGVDSSGPAALIVEAKAHGANFDRAPGGLSAASPDRQIQRYLRQHPASGPSTFGVLTDGTRWRVYARTGPDAIDVRFLREYDFSNVAEVERVAAMPADTEGGNALHEFIDRLCRECVIEEQVRPRRLPSRRLADSLFATYEGGAPNPDAIVPHLLGGRLAEMHTELGEHISLDGIRRDAHDRDWQGYAYALGAPLPLPQQAPAQPTTLPLEPKRLVTAAVRFTPGLGGLTMPDTALCARTFARVQSAETSAVFAYRSVDEGKTEARLAVYADGRVAMTAPFDPELPTASAKTAVESVLGTLADSPDKLDPELVLCLTIDTKKYGSHGQPI